MTKRRMALLEKAFAMEVGCALAGGKVPPVMPSASKDAEWLEQHGLLNHVTVTLGGRFPVTLKGYLLTHLGRMVYCDTCEAPKGAK